MCRADIAVVSWLVQKFVPEFVSATLHMTGIADSLVDVLSCHEMTINYPLIRLLMINYMAH
jgi:hypothetical protein